MRDMRYLPPYLHALSLAALLALTGCGSDPSAGTGGASSASGSGAGGTGGGVSCPPGSHAAAGDCEATFEGWTETSPLVKGRDHHVTFAATTPAGSFLYVAAGTTGLAVLDGVERAAIAADGSLGAFESAGKVPTAAIGPGMAQVDRTVVIAGGLDGQDSIADTAVGVIADDGSVAFTAGPSLGETRYHLTLSAHGGFVYAIGGLSQTVTGGTPMQTILDVIERAPLDGATLGAFEAIAPLPVPLTHHMAVVHGDALYLIGGISDMAARTEILRAAFTADGMLGAFEEVGSLPEGRATSSAFVFLDHLYVIAGAAAAQEEEVDTVLRAPLLANGDVGAFEALTPLPMVRAHSHQSPLVNGFFYSAGGSKHHVVQKQVFVGKLD